MMHIMELFCPFRLSQAYKTLEEQEIQASIPNLKPTRRRKIRIHTITPQRMNSIAESHEKNNEKVSELDLKGIINDSMESLRTTSTKKTTNNSSTVDKLRIAVRTASALQAWTQLPTSEQKCEDDKAENQTENQSLVTYKSDSKVENAQPTKPQTPRSTPKKILVRKESSKALVTQREKDTARLIENIRREKARATEAQQKKEQSRKKAKDCDMHDDREGEKKKNVHVRLFENNYGRSRQQQEPQGSKFFRSIMERRFGATGVGYTFNSLLDSASYRDADKSTLAGSTSGYTNAVSETFLTSSGSVMDMYTSTCVDSKVESSTSRDAASRRTATLVSRSESPERPRTSQSKYSNRNEDTSRERQRSKSRTKSRSQSAKHEQNKSSKSSKPETDAESSGKKTET